MKEIKEAATEKKRGRPAILSDVYYTGFYPNTEKRTAQNIYYISLVTHEIGRDPFYVTDKGNYRRCGILEQIGRLYAAGYITKEQVKELAEICKAEYINGVSVKELERRLRASRIAFKKEAENVSSL